MAMTGRAKPTLELGPARRAVHATLIRLLPARLAHWQDDIAQEMMIRYVVAVRNGYPVTRKMLRSFMWCSVVAMFGTRSWKAQFLPLFNHEAIAADMDMDNRSWCVARLQERWHKLTEKQQYAIFRLVSGLPVMDHSAQIKLATRKLRGESNGRFGNTNQRKLTEQDLRDIFHRTQLGVTGYAIAAWKGVAPSTIHAVLSGRNWKGFTREREEHSHA